MTPVENEPSSAGFRLKEWITIASPVFGFIENTVPQTPAQLLGLPLSIVPYNFDAVCHRPPLRRRCHPSSSEAGTLANIDVFADTVVVMGDGGLLTFAGPPQELKSFFSIGHLGEVFAAIEELGAGAWYRRFDAVSAGRISATPANSMVRAPSQGAQNASIAAIALGFQTVGWIAIAVAIMYVRHARKVE